MSSELVVLSPDRIIDSGFNEKDLPVLIKGQIGKLNELDKSVKKAMKAAVNAKNSADRARSQSAGFGKKKIAIEELQSAGIDLAEAVQSGAEAQKISFEFQTKLAEITKYLFGLGVSNIASNRFVVRELEMRLKGASQEELSELARQEILSVVKQLKEQEDILKKQENISRIVKVHDDKLKIQFEKNKQIDEQLQEHAEINKLHDKQLKIQAETSKKLEEKLMSQAELSRGYSERIQAQAEINKVLDKQLKIQVETDKRLEEKLQAQAKIEKQHGQQLNIHADTCKKLEEQLVTHTKLYRLHGEQLQDHEEVAKIQGEQLKIQSENVKKHDEQLAILQEINNKLTGQIDSNLKAIEAQEIKINMLKDEMANFKILLDSKANNKLSKITLAIAIIAFLLSVIRFFF